MKLYALNEKESRKHPSCVAIPPPNWRISMPSCNTRKQIEVVATIIVEIYAWRKMTGNKGRFENE